MDSDTYQGDEDTSERRGGENPLGTSRSHHEQQHMPPSGVQGESTMPRATRLFQKIRDLRDIHQMAKDLEEENARLKSLLQQVGTGAMERVERRTQCCLKRLDT